MPPRHHYWTIILEGKPTAFRAHTEEELLPTLRQLQVRHPDAVMKWFARGRLWESQDQERAEALARRRPAGPPSGDRRPRDWRPGGEHKDPRDRFKIPRDEKRRRFAENLRRERPGPPENGDRPPHQDRPVPFDRASRPPQFARPPRPDRPGGGESRRPNRPGGLAGTRTNRPPGADRPHQGPRGGKPLWKRDEQVGRQDRPWKRDRPAADRPAGKPPGDRRPPPRGKPGNPDRPSSGRPPNRGGGRPPGGGGRFGPRPQGGRKPGGGGRKGGGGSGR